MLSPVWIPTASMFSMLQMVMQLSLLSLTTSYSISFQPATLRSIRHWPIMLSFRPFVAVALSSSGLWAIPPPVPPKV